MTDDNRFLVTGGAGFIGSALTRHLILDKKVHVVVLDKLTYAGNKSNLARISGSPLFSFVHGDICDRDLVKTIIADTRPTHIFNLAAESHVDRSIDGPDIFLHTNVSGTVSLLSEALAYWGRLNAVAQAAFRFIQVSTDEVYGDLGSSGAFTEASSYRPNSPYAASKASADHFVRAWQRTYGLPTITTNCSNNYGPYQLPEKLIPLCILNAVAGLPIPVYGRGDQVRDWIHVDDHVAGLVAAADLGVSGETYCFGGNSATTNLEVVQSICEIVDDVSPSEQSALSLITNVDDRPGHDVRYAINAEKVARELAWSATVNFQDGLRQTIGWYLSNRDWWEPLQKFSQERLGVQEKR